MANKFIFDLDGTLLECDEACNKAWEQAFSRITSLTFDSNIIEMAGNTDFGIIKDYLYINDINIESAPELARKIKAEYVSILPDFLNKESVRTILGTEVFLKSLKESGGLLGISTGNFLRSTYLKLEVAGIKGYFDVVSTVDDYPDRMDITLNAIRKLNEKAGNPLNSVEKSIIFGDTVNDIEVANRCGIPIILVTKKPVLSKGVYISINDYKDLSLLDRLGIQG